MILEPLCYSSFVFATLVHGVIGYKFCWLLSKDQNQGTLAGHESADTPTGHESYTLYVGNFVSIYFGWEHFLDSGLLSIENPRLLLAQ